MRIAHYAFESLLPDTVAAKPAQQDSAAAGTVMEEIPAAPPPPPTFSEEELEAAKAAAREEGFMAGKQEGRREVDHELLQLQQDGNAVSDAIAAKIDGLIDEHRAYLAARQPELGQLVLGCAEKLAVEALRKEPLADIEAMITQCLNLLIENPEVVVHVHPRLQAQLAKRFQDRAKVVAEPEMNPVDCHIGWQYGEAVRNIDHLWEQIEETINRYFAVSADDMTAQIGESPTASHAIPHETPKGVEDDE